MAEKKMTKREMYNELKGIEGVIAKPHLIKFIDRELELLTKKNSSEKKPTATQEANEKIKAEILEIMANEPQRLFGITEMMKSFPCCKELTNQKVSALVRLLKDEGKVERFEEKRKAYFRIKQ